MVPVLEFQHSIENQLQHSLRGFQRAIRDDFFDPSGKLRESRELFLSRMRASVRAELALACILGSIIQKFGNLLDPSLLADLGEQLAEETRHYKVLRDAIESELGESLDGFMHESFPPFLEGPVWRSIYSSITDGDFMSALLEVEMIHESFARIAMEFSSMHRY